MLHFQAVHEQLAPGEPKKALEVALDRADAAIAEGRDAIQNLRSSIALSTDLAQAVAALGQEFGATHDSESGSPSFYVATEGAPRDLHPMLRDDIYRVAREAMLNAFSHAKANRIEAEITYSDRFFGLRIRDDGNGVDPKHLSEGRHGHWGLPGMRERAQQIGAQLQIWSQAGVGTEVELCVPANIAYETPSGTRK